MAITNMDKIKIQGVLRKNQINSLSDLYFDARTKINLGELYDVLYSFYIKALSDKSVKFNEKYVSNILNGIYCILCFYNDNKEKFSDDDLNKVREMEDLYNSYVQENPEATSSRIENIFENIFEEVIRNVPNIKYTSKEEEEVEEPETKEVEEPIVDIEKDKTIKDLQKQVSVLTKKITSKDEQLAQMTEESKKKASLLKEANKMVLKQSKKIETLTGKHSEESKTTSHLKSDVAKLNHIIEEQQTEISNAKPIIEIYENQIWEQQRKEELDRTVLELIANDNLTIQEIMSKIPFIVTSYEVKETLVRLKNRVAISNGTYKKFKPAYTVDKVNVEEDRKIIIPDYKKSMDVLLVSDMHLGEVSDFDIRTFDKMYDYCIDNGIQLVLNLGDLFSYNHQAGTSNYERLTYNEKIFTKFVDEIPYDKNIHQAILGGNHDMQQLVYGIDPLEFIENNRGDISSMGYTNAVLNIGNDNIGLHHFNKRFPEPLVNSSYKTSELIKTLKEYYDSIGMSRDDISLDLFGHFHKSAINTEEGYAILPSLMADRVKNGAIHLKLYFDSKGNITNVVFIPIIVGRKFTAINEITYRKR